MTLKKNFLLSEKKYTKVQSLKLLLLLSEKKKIKETKINEHTYSLFYLFLSE